MLVALDAIWGGVRDLFSARLRMLAILVVVVSFALTAGAAWALLRYVVPLLSADGGWLAPVLQLARWLAGAAIVVLALLLSPSVSMLVGGFVFDAAAERVEGGLGVPRGRAAPFLDGIIISAVSFVVSVVTVPLFLVPLHAPFFFVLNGYLLGREMFTLAALRSLSVADARALRSRLRLPIFVIGTVATFVPFVAPLFAASAMTRLVAAQSTRPA